ncbi:ribose-5-phosphate isomerase [Burkholderia sp. PAMC 28687]|jgi:ribose 5-phosphate isomerase A|uniref:ribose-5-phosphate isomerase RpiA n=1 Tax=unclassified Burkholderia TaxID=2613784 RepID=UPI00076B89AC|nr:MULTISPECIES: ribose-5-phosphate isomerase RpiA [unclassified Burkholderia]AME24900.1 ribose-5-phosphate isomerase [Burkholderia sp. PAMC 26561]AMM14142.1 ribose-5-phosphate isomerase [Burkholderia sp. PAMC 28687]
MTQDELKQLVAAEAAAYVHANVPEGAVIGVGTGTTANCFIDAIASTKSRYRGAVSSSLATTARLEAHGFQVLELNEIESLPVYVDGADEIDAHGAMIKGGGGALTREKIVASVADVFVCIADGSKRVDVLGNFALPIEVVPMARTAIGRRVIALGGVPVLRVNTDGSPFITDNGNEIIDVKALKITDPIALEATVNGWAGVVTVGLFAARGANVCLLGTAGGVERIDYIAR